MSNDDSFFSVAYPHPFDERVVELCQSAARHLYILSPNLDPAVFDSSELSEAMSALARDSRQTEIRLLVHDIRALATRGHRLLSLARRMPSSLHMRKIADHPLWKGQTLVLRDRNGVLYKPGDADHDAFYQPDSRAYAEQYLEQFEELWRFSEEDPNLRSLSV